MTNHTMMFGPRGYMREVPVPSAGLDISKVGWSAQSNYLSGGAGVRNSVASHKEYPMVWNIAPKSELRPITDIADGLYGRGLLYFLDPFSVGLEGNVLPQHWAFPAQADEGAPPLWPNSEPTLVDTPANSLGYPAKSARFNYSYASSKVYVPVPDGYTAWAGAHGSGAGGIRVTQFTGNTPGVQTLLPWLSVENPQRTSHSFVGGDQLGIELDAINTGGSGEVVTPSGSLFPSDTLYPGYAGDISTGIFTVSGIMVQILPNGVLPEMGGFISGQGHSGCEMLGKPAVNGYTAQENRHLVGMSVRLVETGAWL